MLAEAAATSPQAFVDRGGPYFFIFFNVSSALSLQQATTGTAAHLSCQHSLCLPGIYLAVSFGYERLNAPNRKKCFFLGGGGVFWEGERHVTNTPLTFTEQ